MEGKHNNIINAAARKILAPEGLFRVGSSRTWINSIPENRVFWEVYELAMLCFLKRDFEEGKEYFSRFLQILKASFYVGDLYIEWHEELYNHCIEQLCPELESEETAYKMVCDMIERRRNFFSSKPSYKKLKKEFTL